MVKSDLRRYQLTDSSTHPIKLIGPIPVGHISLGTWAPTLNVWDNMSISAICDSEENRFLTNCAETYDHAFRSTIEQRWLFVSFRLTIALTHIESKSSRIKAAQRQQAINMLCVEILDRFGGPVEKPETHRDTSILMLKVDPLNKDEYY